MPSTKAAASIESVKRSPRTLMPEILALKATPTPQILFATAAISPAHLVPCSFLSTNNK